MTTKATITATKILNRVAVEVGLDAVADPYASNEQHFVQLKYLLQISGEELAIAHPWEFLTKEHTFTTTTASEYSLPDDFLHMVDQSGWNRTDDRPLYGPMSSQQWTYLLGRELVSDTIHVSFRIMDGAFHVFPQPTVSGDVIAYDYVTKNWVSDDAATPVYSDTVSLGTDVPLFDKTLITRHVKMKWLEAKGFDTSKAQDDFNQVFSFLTGKDKGGRILSAGSGRRGFPYLNGRWSVPDGGFG